MSEQEQQSSSGGGVASVMAALVSLAGAVASFQLLTAPREVDVIFAAALEGLACAGIIASFRIATRVSRLVVVAAGTVVAAVLLFEIAGGVVMMARH